MSLLNTLIPSLNRDATRAPKPDAADLGPSLKPAYEVNETAEAYGLTVFLPGVTKDGLELTAESAELRLVGRRGWQPPTSWTAVYRETADAPFVLVLTHDNAIDADKIAAELKDGVLRASLPKAEALQPRKITVS
jgi:HSP20 family molecular chaperone IbpA